MDLDTITCADALTYLRTLPDGCVNCIVTSPPYFGLRDYGTDGQIGLEPTPAEYVAALVEIFHEAKRVLRDDGTLWLNLGDSYAADRGGTHMPAQTVAGGVSGKSDEPETWRGQGGENRRAAHRDASLHGLPHKSLMGIPWRVAFGLQDDGWILRSDIIWAKPNPMPESVTDRPTKAHEYVFLFSKSPRYWYDAAAVSEPVVRTWDASNGGNLSPKGEHKANGSYRERGGEYPLPRADGLRNRRSVWTITPGNFKGAHFATMPEEIPEICIQAGCPEGGVVLDPFSGAGTTALVAKRLNRRYLGSDLNPAYAEMARARIDSIPYTLFSLMEVTGD